MYVPGSPFYISATDNCFYSTQNEVLNGNPIINGSQYLGNLGIDSEEALRNQIAYPSNKTWLGNVTDGIGNTFNSIYEAGEQLYKMGEMMRAILLSGFIDNVIDNIAFNCYFDNDGVLTQGAETTFWTNLKIGISSVILVLIVFTVWYHVSGKGHLLTN